MLDSPGHARRGGGLRSPLERAERDFGAAVGGLAGHQPEQVPRLAEALRQGQAPNPRQSLPPAARLDRHHSAATGRRDAGGPRSVGNRSQAAKRKDLTKRTEADEPVHSFRSLLGWRFRCSQKPRTPQRLQPPTSQGIAHVLQEEVRVSGRRIPGSRRRGDSSDSQS